MQMRDFIVLALAIIGVVTSSCAFAQSDSTSQPGPDLLDEVRAIYKNDTKVNRDREQKFIQLKNERQALLAQEEKKNIRLKKDIERMEAVFNENEIKLADLEKVYEQRVGDFSELSGLMGQSVAALRNLLADSIVGLHLMQWQDRLKVLDDLEGLPRTEDIEQLWQAFLEYIAMQPKSIRFETDVLELDGTLQTREVISLGPFAAISAGDLLAYLPASRQLTQLVRRPSARYLKVAADYTKAQSGFNAAPLDPSRGVLLSLLIQSPTLQERIHQGGIVGYIILLIGAVGLLIGIWKAVTLRIISTAVRRQSNNPEHIGNNPLGRLLSVYRQNSEDSFETLELKLDSTIVRELPSLERGLGAMKVFAAIAPLLGLLGTVTGMIETFQAITLFGTGDPKLMAGGISQALVTTALGLAVAVPIILLHTYSSAKSRIIREVLEEQGTGLVASQASVNKAE